MKLLNPLLITLATCTTVHAVTYPSSSTIARVRSDLKENGYAVIPGFLDETETKELEQKVNSLEGLKDALQHYETSSTGSVKLTRTEDFATRTSYFKDLLSDGALPALVGAALHPKTNPPTTAKLFKEKVNYKHTGCGGFAAHQDAPAYDEVRSVPVCTALVAIDDATAENGCLEFAITDHHRNSKLCHLTDTGIVDPEVAKTLKWKRAELKKGDALLFDSYTIHRSSTNTSPNSRRLLYLTYNRPQDGDHRAAYYKSKRKSLSEGHISRIQHWSGKSAKIPSGGAAKSIPSVDDVVKELQGWYDGKIGASLYDKVVTQREHALQSAKLAETEGADESLIVACLLHDVGHLELDEHAGNDDFLTGDLCHEAVGCRYIQTRGFPESVAQPIALHVPAKRWLCSTDDEYWGKLSVASKRSLEVQGGKMPKEQCEGGRREATRADNWASAYRAVCRRS